MKLSCVIENTEYNHNNNKNNNNNKNDIPSLQCTADNTDISNSLAQRSFGSKQQEALHVVPSAPTYKRGWAYGDRNPTVSRAERVGVKNRTDSTLYT